MVMVTGDDGGNSLLALVMLLLLLKARDMLGAHSLLVAREGNKKSNNTNV